MINNPITMGLLCGFTMEKNSRLKTLVNILGLCILSQTRTTEKSTLAKSYLSLNGSLNLSKEKHVAGQRSLSLIGKPITVLPKKLSKWLKKKELTTSTG